MNARLKGRKVKMLIKQQPVSCYCGAGEPCQERDPVMKVWFFECLCCGRVCGGLSRAETISMWDTAMATITEKENAALSNA